MSDNEVKIKVSLEDDYSDNAKKISESTKQISTSFASADKPASDMGNSLSILSGKNKELSGNTESFAQRVKNLAAQLSPAVISVNLLTSAYKLAINAVKNFGEFLTSSVFAFAEAERASSRLDASLKNIGITSPYVLKEYKNFATEMQKSTGISDEVIMRQLTLATNFGLVGDKAKEAVKAAYALSLGIGMDLNGAMLLVAKAAEGHTETTQLVETFRKNNYYDIVSLYPLISPIERFSNRVLIRN
ncbi:MAG: hypothetical protein LBG46_03335 [Elusimicrobiota bacterium]|jgi:hypothetical protein|nr:hypothetical protein [Elusimicrobiota bacterium]